jgi:D-amino-acid oxidase
VQDVTVIGAGVIGLTTAICLAEAGARVAVHAAQPPDQTTSVAAGALWGPHLVGTDDRVAAWADATRRTLRELMAYPFVRECTGISATAAASQGQLPDTVTAATDVTACGPGEVPAGYAHAWRYSAPVVSMPDYLGYLLDRYLRAGGLPVVPASYPNLTAAARAAGSPVLVSCPGTGARGLVPDQGVVAVRGQVVIARNPGISEFFVGVGGPLAALTYVFPHAGRLVLGGTEQEDDWRLEPDPAAARQILAACAAVVPAVADAEVVAHRVGLRPVRSSVRLEAERLAGGTTVVHNYGHGGSGVTLSWGCGRDAAALALAALDGRP